MLKARWLLTLALLASATLPACNTKTSLGREGDDAGLKGGDAQPGPRCTYGTTQLDVSCNEDRNLDLSAGHCGADGTCSCNSGFVLNPATNRCRLVAVVDAGARTCTEGVDETCDDQKEVTGGGICGGKGPLCFCNTGFVINPATGRCRPAPATDAGAKADSVAGNVCTPMLNQTCNDDDLYSGTAGICVNGSSCSCNSGFVLNSATGRCRAGSKADAATTKVCTFGADSTCNDLQSMSALAGICQSDGTCVCRTGYVLNPATGLCGPATVTSDASVDAPVGKDMGKDTPGVCTFGMNQTCNDDGWASWVAGTCQSNGTCVCGTGYVMNPSSGRCAYVPKDAGPDSKSVCTPGMDQTCNDSPAVSALWGTCLANGTCSCKGPDFVINPSTGKCMFTGGGACTGSYTACGCGCCGGTIASPVCYYPSAGESVSTIRAADEEASKSSTCYMAGCAKGLRYVCCTESDPEPAGSAQYSATYTVGGNDRISLKKTGTDGLCASLTLVNPGSLVDWRPLRLSVPSGWGIIQGSITAGYCSSSSLDEAIGAQGTISFTPNGASCALNAQVTVFLEIAGVVVPVRIDADSVPISGGGPSGYCK